MKFMKYRHEEIRVDSAIPWEIRRIGVREFAKQSGIDSAYVSRMISGKVVCSSKMFKRLIEAVVKIKSIKN